MDTITTIVGGAFALLLMVFVLRLFYTILINLIDGKKFHQSLEQKLSHLRLSRMLTALGISKTDYIYRTNVKDIQQQMDLCSDCKNIEECDEKLSTAGFDVSEMKFCNNEADLKKMKQQQSE